MALEPRRFIGKAIEVHFEQPPALEKKPGCPDGFIWNETHYSIVETMSEWHNYQPAWANGRQYASRARRPGVYARFLGSGPGLFPCSGGHRSDL